MASVRYQQLRGAIGDLRKALLPSRFEPTGTYARPAVVRARAASFRVLTHAELESYFEDRVIEVAKAALSSWKSRELVSSVTLHLLGFSGREMTEPPDTLEPPGDNKRKIWPDLIAIDGRLDTAVNQFVQKVTRDNHGIKEKNLMSMLLPIGFRSAKYDQLFLASLNQFGEDRGLVAHRSGTAYVTQAVDPKSELTKVKLLMTEVASIDAELDALLVEAKGTAASSP